MSINMLLYRVKNNSIQRMQIKAENLLNPRRHYLSDEAKKRLRWMYVIYYECDNNVSKAANKIGISREWLSKLKSKFDACNKDPRKLEPKSKAPHNTKKRNRIGKEVEDKILEVRSWHGWGKRKIKKVLKRDYQLSAGESTVNRYLHKHRKIDPKISKRNKKAYQDKKNSEEVFTFKYRPPSAIKDYQPGALVEKDMKLIPSSSLPWGKYHIKDHFNYQHTYSDSFTRIRFLELTRESNSAEAKATYEKVKRRMPFEIATLNSDHGGENGKYFNEKIGRDKIVHFYSRPGTPTDNPRVERSHLTDEKEFYSRKKYYQKFEELLPKLPKWEHTFNWVRPHQALGDLTPMEFYELWKTNPKKAYQIVTKYQSYLKIQRIRQAKSRKLKTKKEIEKLMHFIDAKLGQQPCQIPLSLSNKKCELCSWT